MMTRQRQDRRRADEGPKGKLVGYARVSTNEQDADLQLDALREAGCRDELDLHRQGLWSAQQRPGLDACLDALEPGDTLLVWQIVRGVRLREPGVDLVRVQDVGLSGANDLTVLEWTAAHQRILLTHDVTTITAFAYERARAGKPMPGVLEVSRTVALRSAIDDTVLLATCSADGDWEGQIRHLPLR